MPHILLQRSTSDSEHIGLCQRITLSYARSTLLADNTVKGRLCQMRECVPPQCQEEKRRQGRAALGVGDGAYLARPLDSTRGAIRGVRTPNVVMVPNVTAYNTSLPEMHGVLKYE
jgi:hypothetical protein